MKTAVGGNAVHAAARPEHGASLGPLVGLGVEDFYGVGLLAAKSAFEPTADNVDLAVDGVGGQMISLGRQIGEVVQHRPQDRRLAKSAPPGGLPPAT